MSRHIRSLAAAALAAGFAAVLPAALTAGAFASPVFWTVSTQTDFLKGTVDGNAEGRLRLGALVEPLADPKEPFIWSIAQSGSAWLAGTGNDGKVLTFTGTGAPSVAFDAAELVPRRVWLRGRPAHARAAGGAAAGQTAPVPAIR